MTMHASHLAAGSPNLSHAFIFPVDVSDCRTTIPVIHTFFFHQLFFLLSSFPAFMSDFTSYVQVSLQCHNPSEALVDFLNTPLSVSKL